MNELKSYEVRVGNHVRVEGFFSKHKEDSHIMVSSDISDIDINKRRFYGIYITDDKLEEIGFKRVEGCYTLDSKIGFEIDYFNGTVELFINGYTYRVKHIRFIHEIQNLYYMMTGQELKMNGSNEV